MFITIFSATLVVEGEITLGAMLAITSIVGQLNSPITQFITFMRNLQDASISLDRLGEIHNKPDEESATEQKIFEIPADADIILKNISFRYIGGLEPVLKELSLTIPANRTTAIVGVSGSGKTTLMKLLLRFYEVDNCLLYTSPSPRDQRGSRMPSSA